MLRNMVLLFLVGALVWWPALEEAKAHRQSAVTDYELEEFKVEKAVVLDRNQSPALRTSRIPRLITRGPRDALPVLASLLDDPNEEVRGSAGRYLAVLGDPRGLQMQAQCVTDAGCIRDRAIALRLLGANGSQAHSELIAREVDRVLANATWKEQRWHLDPSQRTILTAAVVALARLNRPTDRDRVISVVATAPHLEADSRLLEALGYVDTPRSRQLLWDAYTNMLRDPQCFEAHLGVDALLPLSRLNEQVAIDKVRQVIKGVGTPANCSMRAGDPPVLCADRTKVFENLKPRDAARFADVVFEVAAQDPEDLGTREAWIALGIMHPPAFGKKLFNLAMTKKPHWKLVERHTLHDVIMAIDPTLNEVFWHEYEVKSPPAHRAQKELVEMHVGRLVFSGARYWMEWTGD